MTWIQSPKNLQRIHPKPLFTGKTAVASHGMDSTWLLGLTYTLEGEDRCFLFKKKKKRLERGGWERQRRGECTPKRKGNSGLPWQPRPLVSSTVSHHVYRGAQGGAGGGRMTSLLPRHRSYEFVLLAEAGAGGTEKLQSCRM